MSMAPSWLDNAFTSGDASVEQVLNSLNAQPKFIQAVESATAAFKKQEQNLKDHPHLMAPSPAQAARVAFLTALGHEST